MVSHELKTIFVRVPKTASSSMISKLAVHGGRYGFVRGPLWHYDPLHLPLWFMKEQLSPSQYDKYFKFGFVRNPWDKMVSEYHYVHEWWSKERNLRSRVGEEEWGRRYNIVKQIAARDFDMFVRNYDKVCFKPAPYPRYCVIDMLDGCDFVGKFENLQLDWNKVLDVIGLPNENLPHSNKTDHNHYSEFYNDELINIVGDRFKKMIDKYGYDFEEV